MERQPFIIFCCLLVGVSHKRASAVLVATEAVQLENLRTNVVQNNGNLPFGDPNYPIWWPNQPANTACDGMPSFDGLGCFGTTNIRSIDFNAILRLNKSALFNINSVDWSQFTIMTSLLVNGKGGMFGTLPTNIGGLTGLNQLRTLQFGDPIVANPNVNGAYPSNLISQSQLRTGLLYNLPAVSGTVPANLGNQFSAMLRKLVISDMQSLGGAVPEVYFDPIALNLELEFMKTQFSGTIPQSLCFSSARYFKFSVTGNPNIVDPLPTCLLHDCSSLYDFPTVSNGVCTITANDICFLDQPLSADFPVFGGTGVFEDCASPDRPCTITRDNLACVGCDGIENSPFSYDDCGICYENSNPLRGDSCRDCAGEPNGNNSYDVCDVCYEPDDPRRDTGCVDCAGTSNGPATYDSCDICNGDNSEIDCFGVCFGSSQYDHCDVCGGTDDCIDCFGVIGGSAVVDDCGECNGHDACFPCDDVDKNVCGLCFSSQLDCLDCAGVPFGTSAYDSCDVCNGSDDCVDCSGAQHGTEAYDICDICGGDGTSCLDCSGTPFGTLAADACNVCGGSNACHDCAGVELGFAVYDRCDVCEGDGSSCLDCAGVANGAAAYDACDICNGTGPPCLPVAEQERFREEAETKLTNVIIAILLILLSLCVVCVIFYLLLFNRREKRRAKRAAAKRAAPAEEEPGPPVIPMPESGTPVPIKTVALLAVALALISPASASQAGSVQFLRLMKQYTNAGTVYPEWYINEGNEFMTGACVPGTPGLECDNWVIVGLDIARLLAGNVSEPIFNNLQHVRHVFIAAGPQLSFSLANLECALHLESLIVIQSRIYGTLPERIGELQKLHVLELVSTKDLRGDLPLSMNRLNCLKKLIISDAAMISSKQS